MKVLIAGGNGFLGRKLVEKCVWLGWKVDIIVNRSVDNLLIGIENVFTISDIKNSKIDYDFIFNVAAFIPYNSYDEPNEHLLNSNVELPLKLHNLFSNSKIIFASSVSVYGHQKEVVSENSICINSSLYGLSKAAGELITMHHKKYSILRFSSLYGRNMFAGTFIPSVFKQAKDKKMITLFGEGKRKQNYLHVEDAADFCIHAALYGENETYLAVHKREYENREVAQIIADEIGRCNINFSGVDNSPSYTYNNEYTVRKLKFSPKTDLVEGIKKMVDE